MGGAARPRRFARTGRVVSRNRAFAKRPGSRCDLFRRRQNRGREIGGADAQTRLVAGIFLHTRLPGTFRSCSARSCAARVSQRVRRRPGLRFAPAHIGKNGPDPASPASALSLAGTAESTAHNIRRKPGALEAGRRGIEEHLARRQENARVTIDWETHLYRVRRQITVEKILILINGSAGDADRIRAKTDFPNIEIVANL